MIIKNAKESELEMAEKMPKEKIEELKEMIQNRKPSEPVERVLTYFCSRHAVSMKACKKYYELMIEKGEIKKE